MDLNELWETPAWGLAFAMWALAGAVGAGIVLLCALGAWRGRRKRDAGRGER
jgi:ABC-type cobalt transport system substrate-binding protein